MVKSITFLKICLLLLLITNVFSQNMNREYEKIMKIRNNLFVLLMEKVDPIVPKDEIFEGLQRDYMEEYGLMDYPTYKRDFYDSPKNAENEILYGSNLSQEKRKLVDKFYEDLWNIKGKRWDLCLDEFKELFAKSKKNLANILLE